MLAYSFSSTLFYIHPKGCLNCSRKSKGGAMHFLNNFHSLWTKIFLAKDTMSQSVCTYTQTLKHVLEKGVKKGSRAGDVISLFAQQMRFDLTTGFPVVTTKRLAFKSVVAELIWFIEGGRLTNYRMSERRLQELTKRKKTIWSANAKATYWKPKAKSEGDLGRVYGAQWRNWRASDGRSFDQLSNIIKTLQTNPDDRRMILSAWNVGELDDMALPPCHVISQFFHSNGNLSLHMYQRSADLFLGVPFNIASYALLLEMVAQVSDLKAHELIITLGDAHVYLNHVPQAREQITRKPYHPPTLVLNKNIRDIDDFRTSDVHLEGYKSHPRLRADMAV